CHEPSAREGLAVADQLEAIEIETAASPGASIIWMHGLGADGHDFVDVVPELSLPARPGVRFVFPHAPMRPVTINGGYVMRAWYDIRADGGPANRGISIFMAHGTHDPMIPMARALRAREVLTGLGYRVEWHEYPMPHSVCAEEIADIGVWLGKVLGADGPTR